MEENTALLFLANLINGRESQKEGYSLAVRWLCLREDLKDKYIAEAQSIVDAWWSEELAMKASRESGPTPVVADVAPSEFCGDCLEPVPHHLPGCSHVTQRG